MFLSTPRNIFPRWYFYFQNFTRQSPPLDLPGPTSTIEWSNDWPHIWHIKLFQSIAVFWSFSITVTASGTLI